jgi:hypothetical protein
MTTVRFEEERMKDNRGHELPFWRSHKIVQAVKIKQIVVHDPPPGMEPQGGFVFPVEREYGPVEVSMEYLRKHDPQIGGYLVAYEDGYLSYSPAKAFEDGYKPLVDEHKAGNYVLTMRCANGHEQKLEYRNMSRAFVENQGQLMDGSSPFYQFRPGPESSIGKCAICHAQVTSTVGELK